MDMKPIFKVDVDELKRYRDAFDELIHSYERLNADVDARIKQLEQEGYTQQDLETILRILLGDDRSTRE